MMIEKLSKKAMAESVGEQLINHALDTCFENMTTQNKYIHIPGASIVMLYLITQTLQET